MSYLEQRRNQKIFGKPAAEKKHYYIPKQSEKKKKEIEEQKQSGDSKMDLFFQEQRKRMTGKCLFTGEKSLRDDDDRFHFSIAHLLPKRPVNKGGFPSVATHPENWIELSWDAHTDFDNGKISWEMLKDSSEWLIIREKLLILLPLISDEEKKIKLYSRLETLVNSK